LLALNPVLALPGILNRANLASPSLFPKEFNPELAKRQTQTCVDTCGSTCYWQSDIDAALQKGYSLHQAGQTEGSDEYPHEFDDREGFDIPVAGPWYEFPILNSFEVYNGGSPGADRVVFNSEGVLAIVVTHTGATDDDFLQCTAGS